MKREDISTFDASSGLSIVERSLPHWSQAGTICFITWRLADSLPNSVLQRLDVEIEDLLRSEGPSPSNWRSELAKRETKARGQLRRRADHRRSAFKMIATQRHPVSLRMRKSE